MLTKMKFKSFENSNERFWYIAELLGLSIYQYADILGYSKSYIEKIRAGEREITESIAIRMQVKLNVLDKWLLYGIGEPFKDGVWPGIEPKDLTPDENYAIGDIVKHYIALTERLAKVEDIMQKLYHLPKPKLTPKKISVQDADAETLLRAYNFVNKRITSIELFLRKNKTNQK